MATSYPSMPPPPGPLLLDALMSFLSQPLKCTHIWVMSELSPCGPRFRSIAIDREVALTADELNAEWRAGLENEKKTRVYTAMAAIEALVIAHDYNCQQHVTGVKGLQYEVEMLQEQLWKCK